jgi:hypothetical protein
LTAEVGADKGRAPGIVTARGIGGEEMITSSGGETKDEIEILCEPLFTTGSSGTTKLTWVKDKYLVGEEERGLQTWLFTGTLTGV